MIAAMVAGDGEWLGYAAAAKRVGGSVDTIKRWRRQGMPMEAQLREGQLARVVRVDVLLSWWRDRMRADPVHQARVRRRIVEAGGTPPPAPVRKPKPKPVVVEPAEAVEADRPAPVEVYIPALRAPSEYAALQQALTRVTPPCQDVEEFTADRVTPSQARTLQTICAGCPVRELCAAFAAKERPKAGVWPSR